MQLFNKQICNVTAKEFQVNFVYIFWVFHGLIFKFDEFRLKHRIHGIRQFLRKMQIEVIIVFRNGSWYHIGYEKWLGIFQIPQGYGIHVLKYSSNFYFWFHENINF